MHTWWEKNFATLELGDRRLNERAMSIGYALSLVWQSTIVHFSSGTVLKRAYEFCQSKVQFSVIEPHCQMTAENVAERDIVLCVEHDFSRLWQYYG